MLTPSRRDFERLSRTASVVPVYRELTADTLTPVSALERVAKGRSHAFLFESVVGGEKIARYSFAGTDPFATFTCEGGRATFGPVGGRRRETFAVGTDPFDALRTVLARYRSAPVPGLPRFSGGAVGYFAYDAARYVESLGDGPPDRLCLPDIDLMFVDSMLVFDHVTDTVKIVANARPREARSIAAAYRAAGERIDEIAARLGKPQKPRLLEVGNEAPRRRLRTVSRFPPKAYENAVRKALEYIRAGDVFQVVLSRRLSVPVAADPLDVYRSLRAVNPSPYMFLLRHRSHSLVGASPEVMVRVEAGSVTLRPIAGTRPRGRTEAEDGRLEAELLADPKERAEHVMLVDLGRNDVGRVAVPGSVRVDELMSVERYSHVMHITSNVTGRLRPESDAIDALRSALPAGTVSGAPKVRAMEIIDELEPERRGPYAGAVGYIDFSGNLDTCIALRTVILKDGMGHVQTGAGIVADSDPKSELVETGNKAAAVLRALSMMTP
jgi:anthranilate synthase component 1